jgi:predicted RNase H-like nuclease
LEGRLQRQLVLYLEGLDLANPMHALEEITRHNLLMGHLPLERLRGHEELDALMAAYIAYLAATQPERVQQVGDPQEGLISVPAAGLKDFYP